MRCIIVGYGYFGHIIEKKLAGLGLDYVTVDPYNTSSTYRDILDVPVCDTTSDYWFITTPATTHKHAILRLIHEVGAQHIWVEKPLCITYADTAEIMELVAQRKIHLYCDFTWLKHDSMLVATSSLVDTCKPLKLFKMRIIQPKMIDYTKNDVHILLDLLPHPLSMLQALMDITNDEIISFSLYKVSIDKVAITGILKHGGTLLIELDNTTNTKYRDIELLTSDTHIQWNTLSNTVCKNGVVVPPTCDGDAIEKHICAFTAQQHIDIDILKVAQMLENMCDQYI
jgi:hypothetical protein